MSGHDRPEDAIRPGEPIRWAVPGTDRTESGTLDGPYPFPGPAAVAVTRDDGKRLCVYVRNVLRPDPERRG